MAKSTPEGEQETESMNWKKKALECQQDFYEKLGDRRWDLIKRNQRWALESKVAYAMFGEPRGVSNNGYTEKQTEEFKKMCDLIYKTSENLDVVIAFLFVIGNSKHESFLFPIFRVQNNYKKNDYFIDNIGRVYENWNEYKENNKLPPSEIYYPANGIYDSDKYGNVLVEFTESPASSVTSQALSVGDTGVGIASIFLAGAGLVSIFFPPAAPVAAAVGWATAGCGVYGASWGSFGLYDRMSHAQSISLANTEARNCWLSVVGSTFGVGSGLAMKGMVHAIAQGRVLGTTSRVIINMLNYGSLTCNALDILNNTVNVAEKIKNKELTPLDLLQFTTSVLFFTNAAMNSKTASSVIDQVQKDTLSNFSSDLSKRRIRAFNKLVRRSGGAGKMEDRARIIKGITNVGNKEDFFRMTIRAQKHGSSTVLNGEGKFVVNGNAYVDTPLNRQTHVRNSPTVSISSTIPTSLKKRKFVATVRGIKLLDVVLRARKKESILLCNGVLISIKIPLEMLLKIYFISDGVLYYPLELIIQFLNSCEILAQSKGCKTKMDFIDIVRFLCIYQLSKLKEMEQNYQREKNKVRKLLGEEFDESVFAQKLGIKDVNNRECSFLKIINDEMKKSEIEVKKKFDKYEVEVSVINEDGGLKFRSNYHALNEYYHFLVVDGEELTPSQFFSLIRRIVLRNNVNKIINDVNRKSRIITYIGEEGVLVNLEECKDGRFFKTVSILE